MTVVLFTRRNVGLCALSYFVAAGHKVKVVTDDINVIWLAENLGVQHIINQDEIGEYDLVVSVHWNRMIHEKILDGKKNFNTHPCLSLYRGANPVKRYIENKNMCASVAAHVMTNEFDDGEVLYEEFFATGVVSSYAEFYNIALPHYFSVFAETMKRI